MKLRAQITGNIGMYYTCYRLSLMGWNVMPTARNARGIDIIAYNEDGTEFISVQVKTLTKRNPVPLGNNLDRIMGDYFIIINNAQKEPNAFIMLPNEVKAKAHKGEKSGKISYWLQPKAYDNNEFKEKWERIGNGTIGT